MSTHKNGIGMIFYAHGLTNATTLRQYLYYVVSDKTSDVRGNDKSWNWNEQTENNDYVNLAYDEGVGGNRKLLIHDFGSSQQNSVIQDYIVNTLGFNALPEGMIFRAKTKPSSDGTFGVPDPGLDTGGTTEYLELDGDVNPVTVPDSSGASFWAGHSHTGAYVLYAMFWDYRPLIDTFAGKAEDAGWRFRWNDTLDRLEMSFDGVNWFPITEDGDATTLQDALNILAGYYPTEDYDAAIDSNNIIFVRPGSGGAGTITFNSEFQTILDEENGTFVLNTGRKINYEKWA